MPFDGTHATPPEASFGEAAIALMLRRAEEGPAPDLVAELRVLAAGRSTAARLWDAYAGGRLRRLG
jgi:hypothetical protein